MSSEPLRITSRALRAASRALAAMTAFSMIFLRRARVLFEVLRRACRRPTASTMPLTSLETSLDLVCESNEGSGCLTADDAGEPLANVFADEPLLHLFKRFCAVP